MNAYFPNWISKPTLFFIPSISRNRPPPNAWRGSAYAFFFPSAFAVQLLLCKVVFRWWFISRGEKSNSPFIVFSALSLVRQVVASRSAIAFKTSANSFGCLSFRNFSPPLNEYVLMTFMLFYEKRQVFFVDFCKLFELRNIKSSLPRFNL